MVAGNPANHGECFIVKQVLVLKSGGRCMGGECMSWFRRLRRKSFARIFHLQLISLILTFVLVRTSPAYADQQANEVRDTVTVNFVGDILLASRIGDLINSQGPMAPWEAVKDVLASADFTIGNLECPVGTSGQPMPGKSYTFRASPTSLLGLKQSGFDVVSLANNHTLDYGTSCMLETVENVKKYGIIPLGAGATEKEARAYAILEKNGIKIGVLATTSIIPVPEWASEKDKPGLAVDYSTWHPNITASIKELHDKVDIVVVLVHWGEERKTEPEDWVVKLEKALRDAGADIIIGTHPHVLRGIACDSHHLTAYSLGNFVFTTRADEPLCQIGTILKVTLSKDGIKEVQVIPTQIVQGKTILLQGEGRADAIKYLSSLTRPLGSDISDDGQVVEIRFKDMKDHWARFAAAYLAREGIVNGYPDSTFRPEKPLTFGELAKLMACTFFKNELESESQGAQILPALKDHWSYPYLVLLASNGVIEEGIPQQGPGSNSESTPRPPAPFTPDGFAPRKEVCLWVYKSINCTSSASLLSLKSADKEVSPDDKKTFDDLQGLPTPEMEAIEWCARRGIVTGYEDSTFRPDNPVTRGEMAMILWRILDSGVKPPDEGK